jgi:hypothetical protein
VTVRFCALGVSDVVITPLVDGSAVAPTTFTYDGSAVDADVPQTVTFAFTSVSEGKEMSISFNKDVEIYNWEPESTGELPAQLKAWENKPMQSSAVRRRFGGLNVQIDSGGAAATVTPVLDGTSQTALSVTKSALLGASLTFDGVIGRDLWATVASSTAFRVFGVAPIILETLPQLFKGRIAETDAGHGGVKTITGVHLKVCTLGSAVSISPVIDGVTQVSHSVTTGSDEPDQVTLQFALPITGTELALSFDGDVELYEPPAWQVSSIEPIGTKGWDSGPIVLPGGPHDRVWIYEYQLTANAGGDLTFTPYFDGSAFTSIIKAVANTGRESRHDAQIGRGYHGRTPRLRVTSTSAFSPYWLTIIYRATGAMERQTHRMQIGGAV